MRLLGRFLILRRFAHTVDTSSGRILSDRTFTVPSFGGKVQINSQVNIEVKPAGTLEFPHLDTAIVKHLSGKVQPRLLHASDTIGHAQLTINQQGERLLIDAKRGENSQNDLVSVEVPLVHNVEVSCEDDAELQVSDFMETDFCRLSSHSGNVTARRIKTKNLDVDTKSGDIVCTGPIQGNVSLRSEAGNVIAEQRFVGPSLDVSTDTGDIRVAASYADQSKFTTNRGSIRLRNVHNESYVAVYESGDVKAKGIDGSTNIFVKKGDLEVHISRVKHESRIHVEDGDIVLKMSESFPVKITIDANRVIPDTKFAAHGKIETRPSGSPAVHYSAAIQPNVFSPTLTVIAENGNVILESQDWAASLGFKVPSPEVTVK